MIRTLAAKLAALQWARLDRVLATKYPLLVTPGIGPAHTDANEAFALANNFEVLGAETRSADRWVSRARPTFLYVIYAMILWALPMGLVAAINPRISHAITTGMTDYLSALPAELYTLFGTGYLGYATLRQWGKTRGTDR